MNTLPDQHAIRHNREETIMTPGFDTYYSPQPFVRVSALIEYIRCPRRYFYRYGCGLQSNEPRIALHFGEAIHAALGKLLRNQQDFLGAMESFWKVWTSELEDFNDEKRNSKNAQRILHAWQENHKPGQSLYEPIEPTRNLGGISPTSNQSDFELPFAIDLGLEKLLVGRIDFLARHRLTKKLFTGEFKTTSDSGSRFFESFEYNMQMFCYAIACRAWGLEVEGCFLEGLEVKAPLKTKDSTPKIICTPIYFQDHLLDDALQFIRYTVARLIEDEKRHEFDKHFTGCNPYAMFGQPGYNCEYRNLCQPKEWTQNMSAFKIQRDQVFSIGKDQKISLNVLAPVE